MRTNGRRISRETQRRDFCARNGRNETTTSPSMMHLSAARLRCVNGAGAVARGAHSMFCDGGGGGYGDGDTDADDNDDIDKNHVFNRDYNNDKKKKGVGKVGGEEEKEDDEEKKSKKDEEKAKVEMKKTKMEEEKKAKTE